MSDMARAQSAGRMNTTSEQSIATNVEQAAANQAAGNLTQSGADLAKAESTIVNGLQSATITQAESAQLLHDLSVLSTALDVTIPPTTTTTTTHEHDDDHHDHAADDHSHLRRRSGQRATATAMEMGTASRPRPGLTSECFDPVRSLAGQSSSVGVRNRGVASARVTARNENATVRTGRLTVAFRACNLRGGDRRATLTAAVPPSG